MRWNVLGLLAIATAALWTGGCATTTESGAVGINRSQIMFGVSSDQMNAEAEKAYMSLKTGEQRKGELDRNSDELRRVNEIVKRLIPQTAVFRKDAVQWPWEVHVITSPEVNAFCMPGGKIMVYSALIEKLNLDDAQLAAVLGHEISHALREHSRENMSRQVAQQGVLSGLVATGEISSTAANVIGAGSNVFIMLPNNRTQETEADEMGLELMARAGYDPNEAITLWQKMAKLSGGSSTPAWLSDHPQDGDRENRLRSLLPDVVPLYQAARK